MKATLAGRLSPWLLISSISLAACSDGGETGSVSITTWGEEYIEQGIEAEEFEDGWSVRFDEFLISLGDIAVERDEDAGGGSLPGLRVLDLTEPGPHALGHIEGLEAGAYREVSYATLGADAETEHHPSASESDFELMVGGAYTVYVSGTATRDTEEKRFSWGFSEPVVYASCVDESEGQDISGTIVSDGGVTEIELTIHGDHLFYDDLASPDAKLRFDVIAGADADADGEVTLAELADVRLSELSAEDGSYGVGGFDVNDMAAFVAASTLSLGHFNGEGHCTPRRP